MHAGAEILIDLPMSSRGERYLRTVAAKAPPGSKITHTYTGAHRHLVVYGPGTAYRSAAMETHKLKGGVVFGFDMGYWDREDSMRLFIGPNHPTVEQIQASPTSPRRTFDLREDADPNGPVLLVGLGRKSVKYLGYDDFEWETQALEMIRQQYPGRKVLWRPKGTTPVDFKGLPVSHGIPITQALQGCSLVVCRHSNVAVDACVAGVPVHCEGGAARWLYHSGINPDRDLRAQFLARLSWWEWHRKDMESLWQWIQSRCS